MSAGYSPPGGLNVRSVTRKWYNLLSVILLKVRKIEYLVRIFSFFKKILAEKSRSGGFSLQMKMLGI